MLFFVKDEKAVIQGRIQLGLIQIVGVYLSVLFVEADP